MDYEQPEPDSEVTANSEVTDDQEAKLLTPDENPWLETIKTIGMAAILALGIRGFVAEARYIPSGSMLPTLHIYDRLIIDKISYRFSDPVRGDIVVFNPTVELEKEKDDDGKKKFNEAFIKRVIGVPGDRIDVKAGKVYINGKVLSENYLSEPPTYNWSSTALTPDGIVPAGQYLVLGDNRNNSYDSHYWGFVPKDKIVGKASVRFWPIDRAGGINPQPDYK
jgi:signal peptidase I